MEDPHPNAPAEMGTDARLADGQRSPEELEARMRALRTLLDAGVPFLVGGAYAFSHHTGIFRDTKDLDVFLRERDAPAALQALEGAGWRTERDVHGWLHKAFWGEYFVDLIYSAGNEVAVVDDEWFEHAAPAEIFGLRCSVPAPEEILWNKAFILERHRFDGIELSHLILRTGRQMDWERLLRRFGDEWELLFGHVMMFRFAYPSERDCVPDWAMAELLSRTLRSVKEGNWHRRVCRGTLTSEASFRVDVEEWGFSDARAERRGGNLPGERVY